jgi:hypothetical protein
MSFLVANRAGVPVEVGQQYHTLGDPSSPLWCSVRNGVHDATHPGGSLSLATAQDNSPISFQTPTGCTAPGCKFNALRMFLSWNNPTSVLDRDNQTSQNLKQPSETQNCNKSTSFEFP